MTTYPEAVQDAAVKCLPCNAPAVRTVSGAYVCVECGEPKVTATPETGPTPRPADNLLSCPLRPNARIHVTSQANTRRIESLQRPRNGSGFDRDEKDGGLTIDH